MTMIQRLLLGMTLVVSAMASAVCSAQILGSIACPFGSGPNFTKLGISEFTAASVGTPLLRRTLTGPGAVCNDGTQAVMYIRPAGTDFLDYWSGSFPYDDPDDHDRRERWVIWLQGGGGCRDEDKCLERWCSASGMATDTAGNMSTVGSFDAINGTGLLARHPGNAFAGYNHVLLNYCSSDNWIGSETHTSLPTASGVSYDIEFQGEAIVNEALTLLLTSAVGPDAGLGFWTDQLPELFTASEILIVGDSAGANGVIYSLDRIEAHIRTFVAPEVVIRGVLDAGVPPALWPTAPTPVSWASAPVPDYAGYLTSTLAPGLTFWGVGSSALDADCLSPLSAAGHAADGGVHPDICADPTYTLFEHVQTPFFLAMDINDPIPSDRYASWGHFATGADYWAAQALDLNTLSAGAAGPVVPGIFGPKCDDHVRMNSKSFFNQGVRHPGGVQGASFHDLLSNWLSGAAPASDIQLDGMPAAPPYTSSFCP